MDKTTRYREIIRQIIFDYAKGKPIPDIQTEILIDPERDHYKVMDVGFDRTGRVYGSIIHLDLINEKIWIQYDGTNRPVAQALLDAGVPHEDIVLGFHPANLRQYTDFCCGLKVSLLRVGFCNSYFFSAKFPYSICHPPPCVYYSAY